MKITIVMGAFLPVPPLMGGAVEKVWFALAQEFVRAGHEVVQISRAIPQLAASETIEGVKHIRVRGFDAPASGVWLKVLDLIYSLRAKRVIPTSEVILTNTFWLPILLRNPARGSLYVHVARFPKGQMRFYKHAARLQTPSHPVAEAVIAEIPDARAKVKVVPNPRPDAQASEAPEFTGRAKTLLYVGRLHPEKGLHLLIEAFTTLPAPVRETWKLVIVGPSESRFGGGGEVYRANLDRAAGAAPGAIEFRGPIFDSVALEREFRSATLFIYPSLAENGETFGLAPLEAMAHGCPVLVSDLGCFHDFIADGRSGFIFNHRVAAPAAELRSKLADLLADPLRLAAIGEAGYRKSEEYTTARVARQFLDDFETLREQRDV
jgi:glycosyltransferase involved in cell wall biosynthesis